MKEASRWFQVDRDRVKRRQCAPSPQAHLLLPVPPKAVAFGFFVPGGMREGDGASSWMANAGHAPGNTHSRHPVPPNGPAARRVGDPTTL
jgi:hypothetical protein